MIICKFHQMFELFSAYLSSAPTIIEAGAFDGHDTLRLLKAFPGATIHAFEPVPVLFDALKKKMVDYPQIYVYPYALSTKDGHELFWLAERPDRPAIPSQAGSLLAPKGRLGKSNILFPSTMQVPTITLDSWAQMHQVSQIDFLWLDTQGTELAIMQASPEIMRHVKMVFLEVGFIEAYQGQPLYPVIAEWFINQGFIEIARDFDNLAHPDTFFGNMLFVRKV